MMRPPMGKLLPKRIEWLALAVPVLFAGLHLWAMGQPATGLQADGSRSFALGRLIHQLEGRASDFKFRVRGQRAPNPAVVVVEVDERGAQKYGLWPWPRDLMAKGIEHLLDAGAKAIGTDIAWIDEANDPSAVYRELLQKLDAAAPGDPKLSAVRDELASKVAASPDEALEAALKKGGARVVQGVIAYNESDLADIPPAKVAEHVRLLEGHVLTQAKPTAHSTHSLETLKAWSQYSVLTPLPRFATLGNGLGLFSFVPDIDGTIRRTPALTRLSGPKVLIPSLGVATAAAYLDAKVEAVSAGDDLSGLRLVGPHGTREFPFESDYLMLIDYDGPGEAMHRLSLSDVIDGTFDPAKVKDKAVLIGISLAGNAGDQRVTPFKELEPGVFTHAALLSQLLDGRTLSRPPFLSGWEALGILLLGALLVVLIARLRRFTAKGAVIVAAVGAWLLLDQVLFLRGVALATVLPLADVLLTSFASLFVGYLAVDREKLKLKQTFSKYLGEDVMEEALKNPEKLNQGEKREMTVLFSDIRGFTTLSERMLPEKLASFINQYLSPMTAIVFEEHGTLDKYIGDAVMAFWNAPLDQADHALRACRAALAMTKKLEELKAKWRAESYPEFDIGIGINTGPMIVGNMGSDVRVDYTIMGDAVNLGSRLEGTNKEYQTRIILGEGTWEKVKDQVFARRLGAVRVKGKRKPVRIYELRGLGPPQGKDAEANAAFEAALEAYTHQKWDEAQAKLEQVLALWPEDPPARRYLEELPQLRAQPPGPGWDGVYTAHTK